MPFTNAIREFVDSLLAGIDSGNGVVRPLLSEITFRGNNLSVPLLGPTAGLMVNQFDEFPTSFAFTIRGMVAVGQNVSPPPDMESLLVQCEFAESLNPVLVKSVVEKRPLNTDRTFQVPLALQFRPHISSMDSAWEIKGTITVSGISQPVEQRKFTIEIASLAWFLAHAKKMGV